MALVIKATTLAIRTLSKPVSKSIGAACAKDPALAARCVVETGTATYYRALEQATDEPVLRDLTRRIANDEVRHYKHFFRHFNALADRERLGRTRVLAALARSRSRWLPCRAAWAPPLR